MEMNGIEIPAGNSRDEIKLRDKAIKDFYASWNAEHPDKKMWNNDLQDYIHVRFLSIEETSEKVEEVEPKKGTKNQQKFVKILIMRHDNIKMTVGVQKSGNKIQYCITALGE